MGGSGSAVDISLLVHVTVVLLNTRLTWSALQAVYLPTAKEPEYTADGFELSVGTNHLGHFLLARLLLDDLKNAPNKAPRMVIVGSITGNTNTLAGNVPPKADLGEWAAGLGC